MSDCLNALRAIEETWRGIGDTYRQRAGGATIEAINTIRERLERVVFVYVPSHAGVVPNAYADGIAKAYLSRTYKVRVAKLVAGLVRSRSVVYEKRGGGGAHLKDERAFKHIRKGIMEWVRAQHKSTYRGGGWKGVESRGHEAGRARTKTADGEGRRVRSARGAHGPPRGCENICNKSQATYKSYIWVPHGVHCGRATRQNTDVKGGTG